MGCCEAREDRKKTLPSKDLVEKFDSDYLTHYNEIGDHAMQGSCVVRKFSPILDLL